MRIGIGLSVTRAATFVSSGNPAPTISSLGTTSQELFAGATSVTVNGTGFVGGSSVVNVNGSPAATSFVSATQLTATFPASLHYPRSSGALSHAVTVVTAGPGGGTSSASTYALTYPTSVVGHNRADLGVTVATGASAWADQAPSGPLNFAQATAGKQPSILTSGPNSTAFLRGNGSSTTMACPTFTRAQPFEWVLVLRNVVYSSTGRILNSGTADQCTINTFTTTPQMSMWAGSAYTCVNSDLAVGSWGYLEALFNGASSTSKVNGGTAATGNPGTTTMNNGTTIFGHWNTATGQYAQSDIAEIFLMNGLSAGQRTELRAYFTARYSL